MPEMKGHDSGSSTEPRGDWREILAAFEEAWKQGERPQLDASLALAVDGDRPLLLAGLVRIDLEWSIAGGQVVRVEDYLRRFPELAGDRLVVLDLITREYYGRRQPNGNCGPRSTLSASLPIATI